MIVSFKSSVLEALWCSGELSVLPTMYVYQVVEILDLMDSSEKISDLSLLGGFKIEEYEPHTWAVTVTVNNIEPIGSVTCVFKNNDAHDVDFNEFN